MDRVRVLGPSISFAAHFTGAALLATVPLFLPERLPDVGPVLPAPPSIDNVLVASLGGRAGGGGPVKPVRVDPPVRRPDTSRIVAPVDVQQLVDTTGIDLRTGVGVPGLEGLGEGGGTGFCIVNCGGDGDGPGEGVGSSIVPLPEKPQVLRAGPGGDVRAPVKIRHVTPVYPSLAISARVQGSVVIDCVIDDQGRVTSVKVLRSNPLLEQAAVDAVKQWRYRPTLLNGTPVSVLLTVTVDFSLR